MITNTLRGSGKLLALLLISSVSLVGYTGFSFAEDLSVTLQWKPSLSNGVVLYNLYRSQNSGSGYQIINSQPIAGTNHTDETIQPGIDYYYVCRAVTLEGTESINSNEAFYFLESQNAAPDAENDTVQTEEDNWVDITPLSNDYDDDGDFLEITALTQPLNGTAVITSPSDIRYTPNPDFYGQDTFTYTVTDSEGNTAIASVNISISPVNDPPLAVDDFILTNEDTAAELNLLANDTDPDNETLSLEILKSAASGNVEILPGGWCRYTPSLNFSGTDFFTYRISDSSSASSTATVDVTVEPVNDSPVAVDDSFTTIKGTSMSLRLLVNDTDPEGDSLILTILTQPANGSVTVQADGSVLYAPLPEFIGSDYFTYSVTDSGGEHDSASVFVTVAPMAVGFRAVADALVTTEDSPVTLNILNNDENPDNFLLNLTVQSSPLYGQAEINQDGDLTYIPNADFNGTDSLTYSLTDAEGNTSIASVNISISPVNDPPIAVKDSASTSEDESVTLQLLANDSDIDNDELSASLRSTPANGMVTVSLTGEAVYSPDKNFFGNDSFTYEVSDGTNKASAEALISVTPVNDPPEAVDDSATTGIDESVNINVLSNDNDPEGDAVSATLNSAPKNGTVKIQTDGQAVYTPAADFSGTDSFTYRAADTWGAASSATVSILVTGENRPPVAKKDSTSVAKKSMVVFNVLANDTDPDGDSLELVEISTPANGTAFILTTSGDIEYKPEIWFKGTDSFTYIVSDGEEETTGIVNVSVISRPSVLKFSFPRSIDADSARLQDTFIGVGVVNPNKTEEVISFIGFDENGTTRDVIQLGSKLPPQGQVSLMTSELGQTNENVAQLTVEGESGEVQGFFMVGDTTTSRLDGVGGVQIPSRLFYFPAARENEEANTLLYLINQDSEKTTLISATLYNQNGEMLSTKEFQITPNGSISGSIRELFGDDIKVEDGYVKVSSSTYVNGYEIVVTDKSFYTFSARIPRPSYKLFAPHFIAGEGNNSEIRVLSTGTETLNGVITLMNDLGQTMVSNKISIEPAALSALSLNSLLKEKYALDAGLLTGSVLIELDEGTEVIGTITMHTADSEAVTAMPMADEGLLDFVFPQVAQSSDGTIFMGFAILNPGSQTARATISAFNSSGVLTAEKQLVLPPLHRLTDFLSGDMFFGAGFSQIGGHIKLVSDYPIVSVSIYGDYSGRYLSTAEGQLGEVEAAAAVAELERTLAEQIDN
ncbi:MAG: Ig-like domain-containing protein [Acidobacteriota bacterium]